MNPTLDLIENRRSVRFYSTEPLSQEERDAILRAAFSAPTSGAMMLYSIIEVEDQALKDHLAETCHQPFIAKAPYLLLFLADFQRWMDIYTYSGVQERCQELGIPFRTPKAGELMLSVSDALLAAHTAVIAAESLGIGSCYVGDILGQHEVHQQMFDLPPYVLPVTLVSFGHPDPAHPLRGLIPRFDRRFIVHTDRYQRLAREEVDTMFQLFSQQSGVPMKMPEGSENLGMEIYLHKFNPDTLADMNRSINEVLKNWS